MAAAIAPRSSNLRGENTNVSRQYELKAFEYVKQDVVIRRHLKHIFYNKIK